MEWRIVGDCGCAYGIGRCEMNRWPGPRVPNGGWECARSGCRAAEKIVFALGAFRSLGVLWRDACDVKRCSIYGMWWG